MKVFRYGAAGFAVRIHHVEHKTKNTDAYNGTDPDHDHVNVISYLTDFGDTLGHIELASSNDSANALRRYRGQ